jgi:NarL family two-component system sensor histidine kinase LiaS
MDEPLDNAVAQAAEEVAGRVGLKLKLSLQEGIEVPVETREALVRIVREAVSNATRHGKANTVTIALAGTDGIRLRISDDGIGFDPETRDGPGFGLTSMNERAHALGGSLNVASAPGSGTALEVVLP